MKSYSRLMGRFLFTNSSFHLFSQTICHQTLFPKLMIFSSELKKSLLQSSHLEKSLTLEPNLMLSKSSTLDSLNLPKITLILSENILSQAEELQIRKCILKNLERSLDWKSKSNTIWNHQKKKKSHLQR